MKISALNPFINNKISNCQVKNNISNNTATIPIKSAEKFSYPANYYVSFGSNNDVFEQMQQDLKNKDIENLKKNFSKLTKTAQQNAIDTAEKFKDEGLTFDDYLIACAKRPQLFYRSPDTIENNVRDLVRRFEDDGLTTKAYLPACVKKPQLFYQSPDTIEKNVRNLVQKFQAEGLTAKAYLPACVKQPQLFTQTHDTIENNVREVVKRFEKDGLTVEAYLPACVKQPPLFALSPDTIAEHINMYKFCNRNQAIPLNTQDLFAAKLNNPMELCLSTSLILIKKLIIPKMFPEGNIPKELKGNRLREKLNDYLIAQNNINPNVQFNLEVKGDEKELRILQETIEKISQDAIGRNDAFKIV